MIVRIHQNIAEFAQLVALHFRSDATLHLAFSYSTFPALFGFFTLESFSDLAAQLILMLIDSSGVTFLARSMITTFFLGMQKFFFVFWINLTPFTFQGFLNAATQSVPYLTHNHIQVLHVFASYHSKVEAAKLVIEIILDQMTVYAKFGSNPANFGNLRESIQNCVPSQLLELIEIFLSKKRFTKILPDVVLFHELKQIPLVMSDRDVHTLCEIIGFESEIGKQSRGLLKTLHQIYHRGYAPFHGNIPIPKWCHSRRTWSTADHPESFRDFELFISVKETERELFELNGFLTLNHKFILNQHSGLTVSKAIRQKKKIQDNLGLLTTIVPNDVYPVLLLPLLFAFLNVVQIDKSTNLSAFEKEFAKCRNPAVPKEPRTSWIEKEVLQCFKFGFGWRIAKLIAVVEVFETAFPKNSQNQLVSIVSAIPSKELLETIACFKVYIAANPFIRGRLVKPIAGFVRLLDNQFALACKPIPRLYFWYTTTGR
jgi:hypothetical protein